LEWAAFAHYVSVRHRSADAILQVDSERRRFPFIRVPFRLLPDKFKVIGKVLDAEAVPTDITFAMRLADFEVV
jgi:hypothetical protein